MLKTSILILAFLSGQNFGADDPDDSTDDPDKWIGEHLLAEAADYTVFVQQDEEQLTELVYEEPLLRYFDPLTNVPVGYFLVWTRQQRPEACATFWVHQLPNGLRELHEFQSLSTQPIRARRGETDVWRPTRPPGSECDEWSRGTTNNGNEVRWDGR